jgi:D-tyrosyl-tRNA(Tyr) deacylase
VSVSSQEDMPALSLMPIDDLILVASRHSSSSEQVFILTHVEGNFCGSVLLERLPESEGCIRTLSTKAYD